MVRASVSVSVSVSKWGELPNDILGLIFEQFGLVDRIRLQLVCKSWRSANATALQTAPPHAWLFSGNGRLIDRSGKLTFFDGGSQINLKLPKSVVRGGGWFKLASNGWLLHANNPKLIVSTNKNNKKLLSLYDPITKHRIPLPSMPTGFFQSPNFIDRLKSLIRLTPRYANAIEIEIDPFVQAAVSSSDASECVVAVSFYVFINGFRSHDGVALCRPLHDERWTLFRFNFNIVNMLFREGVLYVLYEGPGLNSSISHHSLGVGVGVGVGEGRCELKLKIIRRGLIIYHSPRRPSYLVESKGQVWIVIEKPETQYTQLRVTKRLHDDHAIIQSFERGLPVKRFSPNIRIGAFT